MSRLALCAALAILAAATPASAGLPRTGVLVPGRSLGGVHLGETSAEVGAALGRAHGVCRGCAVPTWYFTYKPYDAHGLAVELTDGRVSAVYTLWEPAGWNGPRGLVLGADEAQVTSVAGPLLPVTCTGYTALVRDSPHARTVYYISAGQLWAFGLLQRHADPCR